jgi:hypothetical protein
VLGFLPLAGELGDATLVDFGLRRLEGPFRAADEIREAQREVGDATTSSMNAAGPSTGGMGASSNAGNGNATMTTRGLATAVSILRRSL